MENKENYCNNPLRRLKSKQNYSKKNFLGNQRQKPEYERVMSSRLIRQVKKHQILKKLTYDLDNNQIKASQPDTHDYHKDFSKQFDLVVIPKPEEKTEKPYKEDFFSNFETYHVCDDYAEDIINYLKERDVSPFSPLNLTISNDF